MSDTLRAVVIGCGAGGEGRAGAHSIGYMHGGAYQRSNRVELVAAADINETNAAHFAEHFGFERTYTDFREMLDQERPDLVSASVWPPLHPEMVIAAAEAGARGVWCEKPMALSLGDVDRMMDACDRNGTRLVVNHQRRYLPQFQEARRLIAEGDIGDVLTIHAGIAEWDLLSWGTHWIDMYRFLLGERRCEWVVAQVDARSGTRKYGHVVEDHTLACFAFEGGPHAFLETGRVVPNAPAIRIAGSDGIIDILDGSGGEREHKLRYLSSRMEGWVVPELTESGHSFDAATDQLLADLIGWITGGPEPAVSGRGARATTEMMLACYESARQGSIIDLPLGAMDFPLEELVARAQSNQRIVR